jgi:hypothetical protein
VWRSAYPELSGRWPHFTFWMNYQPSSLRASGGKSAIIRGHGSKAALSDQAPRDQGALAVELVGAVRGLADQHTARIADLVEQRAVVRRAGERMHSLADRPARMSIARSFMLCAGCAPPDAPMRSRAPQGQASSATGAAGRWPDDLRSVGSGSASDEMRS